MYVFYAVNGFPSKKIMGRKFSLKFEISEKIIGRQKKLIFTTVKNKQNDDIRTLSGSIFLILWVNLSFFIIMFLVVNQGIVGRL